MLSTLILISQIIVDCVSILFIVALAVLVLRNDRMRLYAAIGICLLMLL